MNFPSKEFIFILMLLLVSSEIRSVRSLGEDWNQEQLDCLRTKYKTFLIRVEDEYLAKSAPKKPSITFESLEKPPEGENQEYFLSEAESAIMSYRSAIGMSFLGPQKKNNIRTAVTNACYDIKIECGFAEAPEGIKDALESFYDLTKENDAPDFKTFYDGIEKKKIPGVDHMTLQDHFDNAH